MPGEDLMALAQWAGLTVTAATVTDVGSARLKFARLLGHGDPSRTEVAERWLAETHQQLVAAEGADLESARAAQAQRWEGRFADLLDEDPDVEGDLRALVEEIQAALPAGMVSAAGHRLAAEADVNIGRNVIAAVLSDPPVNGQFVLLNDQPVSKLDTEDVLGVASEVTGLANLIIGSRYSAPFTVGIDADWGMGKSTLMLQLQAALDARQKEGVVTRWFNAWTAQKSDALAGLIKSALMEVDENALRRLLRRVAANRGLLIGLRVMFIAAASFLHLGRVVDQLWDLMSVDARSRNEILRDLEGVFSNWAAQTKRTPYGRLLVVFVDDLDRCSTEVIVGVCEAMRLYLAVPGIVFVIGCDQQVLTRAAQRSGMDSQAATSLGFLEKIIQITYHKPAPDERQMSGLVEYYAGLSRAGGLLSEQARQIVMQGTGRNPRRVKRLLNSIILQYDLDPEWKSLGLENLSAVNLLMHFYPEFYRELTQPNSADMIHNFLAYRELRGRVQRGDPLDAQDQQFFKANGAPEPSEDPQNIRDVFSFLETQLPKSFPDLAGQPQIVQLLLELVDNPKFDQLMDWLQRRAPAKAAPFVLGAKEGAGADEGSIGVGLGTVAADRGGTAIGQVVYQQRVVAEKPVRLAPRLTFRASREELLTELDARLAGGEDSGLRTVALCGLGGAGKTVVAVEYAHRHLAELGLAWQLAAEDPVMLTAGFSELGAQLGARDLAESRNPVALVHGALTAFSEEWLLIFDNAPDFASVQAFLPPAGKGRVLITSRNPSWPSGLVLNVPVLDAGVAAGFLVSRTGDRDSQAALELAAELGGLPLALEQAAAYILATGGSLAEYLELFRHRRSDLLDRGEPSGYSETVTTTWVLSLTQLEQSAPGAVGLLRLLAFCAPDAVPLRLLLQRRPGLTELLSPQVAEVVVPLLEDELAAGDAIAALRGYSLVHPAGDGAVSVHRLVQAVTADQMPAELANQWRQAAAALIEAAIPKDSRQPDTWPDFGALLPHAEKALAPGSSGMERIASYLGNSGSVAAARDLQRRILGVREQMLGPEHPETLIARRNLARWTGRAGDAAEALRQGEALLPVIERVLGAEAPDTLAARADIAHWTRMARRRGTRAAEGPARAAAQYAELLPDFQRILGPEHPDTLAVRAGLAWSTGEAGDAAGARDQFAALLPVFQRILGPEDPLTLDVRAGLARWTGGMGDAAGARDQFAALLPVFQRILGPEHPDTLYIRHSVARWTGQAGDPAGARDQYEALLSEQERILGPDHPDTKAARDNLAYWTKEADSEVN